MKDRMAHNRLPESLHSVLITLSSSAHSITDRFLREHLQDRHSQVMEHYKNEMIKLFLEVSETKLQESHLLFDIENTKLWQDQRSLPVHQRLNQTMIQFMESQLALIARKIECIYNYKLLQQQQ